jgi:hypothetical protein
MRATPREFRLTVGMSETFVAVHGFHPINRVWWMLWYGSAILIKDTPSADPCTSVCQPSFSSSIGHLPGSI